MSQRGAGDFHLIFYGHNCAMARGHYSSLEDVERDFGDVVSWVGPLTADELADEIHDTFYPPGTGPISPEAVQSFVRSTVPRQDFER